MGSEQNVISSLEFGAEMLLLFLQSHDAKGTLVAYFYMFEEGLCSYRAIIGVEVKWRLVGIGKKAKVAILI